MTDHDDSTRGRLLEAAEALFSDRGFEGVGVREIADTAGVNLSGIKYHFGSKHGLYMQAIHRAMDRQGSTAAWAILECEPKNRQEAARVFRGFVGAFLGVLLRSDEAGSSVCLVMQSALESGEATDLVVQEFVEPHHARLRTFVSHLRPGAAEDECARAAHSVMALLLYQRLFRPFLDRLDGGTGVNGPTCEVQIERLADEITGFVLCGMGCGDLTASVQPPRGGADEGVRA